MMTAVGSEVPDDDRGRAASSSFVDSIDPKERHP